MSDENNKEKEKTKPEKEIVPDKSVPVKPVPDKSVPVKPVPVKPVPDKSVPVKPVPDKDDFENPGVITTRIEDSPKKSEVPKE